MRRQGKYGNDAEYFWWGGWFASVHDQLDDPLCSVTGGIQPCRYADEPWPYFLAFGDFDGDSKDEYLIQSGWGLGVIGISISSV